MAIFKSIIMGSIAIYIMIFMIRVVIRLLSGGNVKRFVTPKEYAKSWFSTVISLIVTVSFIMFTYQFTVFEKNSHISSTSQLNGVEALGIITTMVIIAILLDYTLLSLYRLVSKTVKMFNQRKNTVVNRFYKSIYSQDDKDIVEQYEVLQNSKHAKCALTNEQALIIVSALIKNGENDKARQLASQFGHHKHSQKYEPAFQLKEE